EGVMVFFLIWSLYLLQKGNWIWSAVVLALSIATKLIPLLFLPLFFQWFTTYPLNTSKILHLKSNLKHHDKHSINKSLLFKNIKKLIVFYTVVGITTVLLFAPFFSLQFVSNYTQTVGLW
ncbi:mannosyltransferase, partial [Seonamhaeicola marinus]